MPSLHRHCYFLPSLSLSSSLCPSVSPSSLPSLSPCCHTFLYFLCLSLVMVDLTSDKIFFISHMVYFNISTSMITCIVHTTCAGSSLQLKMILNYKARFNTTEMDCVQFSSRFALQNNNMEYTIARNANLNLLPGSSDLLHC